MPVMPEMTRARMPVTAISLLRIFFVRYPPWDMLNDEMRKARKTKRETAVRQSWRKKRAMSGAQKKRMAYIAPLTMTLNVKTAL